MKEYILILILFITGLDYAQASPDSLYYKANDLYRSEKYEEAIDLYKSILVAGYESSNLYYNLGNAYFRSNKLGKARLYYEKAIRLNPGDEDALANLNYLEGLLADKFEDVPVIFFKKWIKSVIVSLSSDSWSYISAGAFLLCCLSLITYLFLRSTVIRKIGFYAALALFMISLISFVAAWEQYNLARNPDTGVVTDLLVNARSSPHESGTEVFVLHEGAKVNLKDKTSGWQEIRLSDGRKGWIPSESIEPI